MLLAPCGDLAFCVEVLEGPGTRQEALDGCAGIPERTRGLNHSVCEGRLWPPWQQLRQPVVWPLTAQLLTGCVLCCLGALCASRALSCSSRMLQAGGERSHRGQGPCPLHTLCVLWGFHLQMLAGWVPFRIGLQGQHSQLRGLNKSLRELQTLSLLHHPSVPWSPLFTHTDAPGQSLASDPAPPLASSVTLGHALNKMGIIAIPFL